MTASPADNNDLLEGFEVPGTLDHDGLNALFCAVTGLMGVDQRGVDGFGLLAARR
jgi:hypothetical protein